jgi:hypothetical protein
MKLPNKVYDILKWVVITVMPALMTCFSTIGIALGWEFTEIVIVIVGALTTCLGTIIGVSGLNYAKQNK